MELFLILLILLVNPAIAVIGPTQPAADVAVACSSVQFIADNENYCFYWQCMRRADGSYSANARMCALGSRVSDSYLSGTSNPCAVKFTTSKYECHRTDPIIITSPDCAELWRGRCNNEGELMVEPDMCWCKCTEDYTGPFCDKEVSFDNFSLLSDDSAPCIGGEPMEDWCAQADGCLNGGTCYNQCDDFWCSCPNQEVNTYVGKRCENYDVVDGYK